jgi:hypothetical protein
MEDPSADQLIVPLNVIVGGQASPTDSAPPLAASQTVARFLDRCARTTIGRWREVREGRRDLNSVWQPERWARELMDDLHAAGLDGEAEGIASKVLDQTRNGVLEALVAEDPDRALAHYFSTVSDDG